MDALTFIQLATQQIAANGGKVPAEMQRSLERSSVRTDITPITVNELKRQAKLITQTIMYGHLN